MEPVSQKGIKCGIDRSLTFFRIVGGLLHSDITEGKIYWYLPRHNAIQILEIVLFPY